MTAKRVCIAVDRYKRKVFRRGLHRAGYVWGEQNGITPDTILMFIETNDKEALHMVVRACNAQAQRQKHG